MAKDIPIGTRAEVTNEVEHRHTLAALSSDLPSVLATPWMIGWMEYACYQAQQPFCEDGETTVGTAVHVDHRAPTTIGQMVIAEAVLERIEGRFFIYRVSARNEQQPIGSGTVHRAVVNVKKFMEKTKASGDRAIR
ncbi:MAG TPA: thioesterase family protein [Terriglobales bacterium]|jgi:fluoroacetyl-CoA thioesterase|nr:thioesterase family protein [Terriglobales bacterium]